MGRDPGDRGRLIVATAITVAALPFLWSSKQSSPNRDSLAAIAPGAAPAVDPAAVAEATAPTTDIAATVPAFAVGRPGRAPAAADDGVVTIDVGAPHGDDEATGTAIYRRWKAGLTEAKNPCASPLAPYGARVVVTNTDNGYNLACTNVSTKPLPSGVVIVLDTDVFLELADLGDSPIPVEISW